MADESPTLLERFVAIRRGSFYGALFSGMGVTWGLVMFGIQATRPR